MRAGLLRLTALFTLSILLTVFTACSGSKGPDTERLARLPAPSVRLDPADNGAARPPAPTQPPAEPVRVGLVR